MKKHYYALFKKSEDVVEVEFPDLIGCSTFGKDWEEALSYAEDALAAWLVHADSEISRTSRVDCATAFVFCWCLMSEFKKSQVIADLFQDP